MPFLFLLPSFLWWCPYLELCGFILYKASRHGNICSKDVKLHLNTCCLVINANNIQNTRIYPSSPFRKCWPLQLKEKRAAIAAPLSAAGAPWWRSSSALLRADGGQQECMESEKLRGIIVACAGTIWFLCPRKGNAERWKWINGQKIGLQEQERQDCTSVTELPAFFKNLNILESSKTT